MTLPLSSCSALLLPHSTTNVPTAFHKYTPSPHTFGVVQYSSTKLHMFAPPSSGYSTPDEEESALPETYEPTMEYPGTMRPGRTPENMPLHDLPIGDNDPDPIPWPHFQEIDWYHTWGAPHPHPIPMDEFIELHGRWATLEDEAEMRKDARRGVRERREAQEKEKTSHQVMDDTDDDDDITARDLGEGVQDFLSNVGEEAKKKAGAIDAEVEEGDDDDDNAGEKGGDDEDGDTLAVLDEEEEEDDEEEDDFLLELGLDMDGDDDDNNEDADTVNDDDGNEPAFSSEDDDSSSDLLRAMQGLIDMDKEEDVDVDDDGIVLPEDDDGDLDMSLNFNDDNDVNDDDNEAEVKVVPIENLDENDELDDHDDITFDDDNQYDDGGFDLDVDNDFEGGIGDDDDDDDDGDDDGEDDW